MKKALLSLALLNSTVIFAVPKDECQIVPFLLLHPQTQAQNKAPHVFKADMDRHSPIIFSHIAHRTKPYADQQCFRLLFREYLPQMAEQHSKTASQVQPNQSSTH